MLMVCINDEFLSHKAEAVPDTLMGFVALPWEAVAWIGSVV